MVYEVWLLRILLIFCVGIGSCTTFTKPVLIPAVDPALISEEGFITQRSDSLKITYGHLHTTPQFWIFSVRIINKSATPIRVNPDLFYYKITDSLNRKMSIPYYAHSRDYLLNYAEKELGKEAAKLSYKELTPRLVQAFDNYLLKSDRKSVV